MININRDVDKTAKVNLSGNLAGGIQVQTESQDKEKKERDIERFRQEQMEKMEKASNSSRDSNNSIKRTAIQSDTESSDSSDSDINALINPDKKLPDSYLEEMKEKEQQEKNNNDQQRGFFDTINPFGTFNNNNVGSDNDSIGNRSSHSRSSRSSRHSRSSRRSFKERYSSNYGNNYGNSGYNNERDSDNEDLLTADQIYNKKSRYIHLLDRLHKRCGSTHRMTMNNSLRDIKNAYRVIKKAVDTEDGIEFSKRGLMFCVTGIEFLNKRYDPFGVNLKGWSKNFLEEIDEYDDVLEELYDKYADVADMSPEIKLLFMIGGSAFMYNITNNMFNNNDINDNINNMRNNPNLFAKAMNFAQNMKNGMPQRQQQQPPPQMPPHMRPVATQRTPQKAPHMYREEIPPPMPNSMTDGYGREFMPNRVPPQQMPQMSINNNNNKQQRQPMKPPSASLEDIINDKSNDKIDSSSSSSSDSDDSETKSITVEPKRGRGRGRGRGTRGRGRGRGN